MRNLLTAFTLFLSACLYSPLTPQEKLISPNQVSIIDMWVMRASNGTGHVTVVVANPTQDSVSVYAVCEYVDSGELFGVSNAVEISSGMRRTFMVLGFFKENVNTNLIKCYVQFTRD